MTDLIRDLILSIALYGGVALTLAVWTQINWWLYGNGLFWINQIECRDFFTAAADKFKGEKDAPII